MLSVIRERFANRQLEFSIPNSRTKTGKITFVIAKARLSASDAPALPREIVTDLKQ
jgi:hypothetical protein